MKQTRLIMGMPINVEIVSDNDEHTSTSASAAEAKIAKEVKIAAKATKEAKIAEKADVADVAFEKVFDYFHYVDEKFSIYKDSSEIMMINRGDLKVKDASEDMKEIFDLAEQTKKETDGYFDIVNRAGILDPSGIVKGWAILKASGILESEGYTNYFVEAGGDIQVGGKNEQGELWKVGIRNPFVTEKKEIVKVVLLGGETGMNGIATSGTYLRGQHIYNPKNRDLAISDIVSLTVIGPNVYEADRFATAAFAMGKAGIGFIEEQKGLEGYIIDNAGVATMTSGLTAISDIVKKNDKNNQIH